MLRSPLPAHRPGWKKPTASTTHPTSATSRKDQADKPRSSATSIESTPSWDALLQYLARQPDTTDVKRMREQMDTILCQERRQLCELTQIYALTSANLTSRRSIQHRGRLLTFARNFYSSHNQGYQRQQSALSLLVEPTRKLLAADIRVANHCLRHMPQPPHFPMLQAHRFAGLTVFANTSFERLSHRDRNTVTSPGSNPSTAAKTTPDTTSSQLRYEAQRLSSFLAAPERADDLTVIHCYHDARCPCCF